MRRLIAGIALAIALTALCGGSLHAANCEFRLGFKTLRDLIGHGIVGECLENEYYNAIGDSNQRTTGGLMAWRKADNWTAFTDGYRTWINGPNGLVQRLNTERFPWEADHIHTPPPTPGPAPPPAPTAALRPTVDPTLAHAYHVMRNTPTGNKIADKFVQLGMSAVFGHIGDYQSQYETSPRRITISEAHRYESNEALAFALIWPTIALMLEVEDGPAQSWEECMLREGVREGFAAQYWLEVFGADGKRNPTLLEQSANNAAAWLNVGNIKHVWMDSYWRDECNDVELGPYIDPDLARAYVTAMQGQSELGQAAVDVVVDAGTEVVFGRINGWGAYSPSRNRITISESLRGYSGQVLAAVLIHETYHVESHRFRGGRPQATAAECLQEEVDAFRLQASWWYDRYGRYGKRSPNSVERSMNNVMWAWFNDNLREWVLLSESYQYQCLGGVVE